MCDTCSSNEHITVEERRLKQSKLIVEGMNYKRYEVVIIGPELCGKHVFYENLMHYLDKKYKQKEKVEKSQFANHDVIMNKKSVDYKFLFTKIKYGKNKSAVNIPLKKYDLLILCVDMSTENGIQRAEKVYQNSIRFDNIKESKGLICIGTKKDIHKIEYAQLKNFANDNCIVDCIQIDQHSNMKQVWKAIKENTIKFERDNTIKCFLKSEDKSMQFTTVVNINDTVDKIKQKFYLQNNKFPEAKDQILKFAGKELEDNVILKTQEIGKSDIINLIVASLPTRLFLSIKVTEQIKEKVEIRENRSISDLYNQLQQKQPKILPSTDEFYLLIDGEKYSLYKRLSSININEKSIISVVYNRKFTINIKTITDKQFEIEILELETIQDLKKKIYEKNNTLPSVEDQVILINRSEIENDQTIQKSGIYQGIICELRTRQQINAKKMKIFIQNKENSYEIQVLTCDKISDIKLKLAEKNKDFQSQNQYKLIFHGNILQDDHSIKAYYIKSEDTIQVFKNIEIYNQNIDLDSINIQIKPRQGKIMKLTVKLSNTILEVKKQLIQDYPNNEIPQVEQFAYIYGGKVLQDSKCIKDYGILKESIIHQTVKKRQ